MHHVLSFKNYCILLVYYPHRKLNQRIIEDKDDIKIIYTKYIYKNELGYDAPKYVDKCIAEIKKKFSQIYAYDDVLILAGIYDKLFLFTENEFNEMRNLITNVSTVYKHKLKKDVNLNIDENAEDYYDIPFIREPVKGLVIPLTKEKDDIEENKESPPRIKHYPGFFKSNYLDQIRKEYSPIHFS